MSAGCSASDARRWLPLCLGIAASLQLVVVNHWRGFASPNERARAYQAIAIATRGSLTIDAEVARFGAMEDIATVGGHLYPNKAPGATPLVVPAALVAHLVAGSDDAELAWTLTLGRLLASSLPFLLTALLMAGYLRAAAPVGAAVAVVAFALGSPALTASLLLFSHSLTAFLLFAAFLLLRSRQRPEWWRAALAGLAIGWAVTSEYPALVPGAVLAILALRRLRTSGALALAGGGALPAAALAAYNSVCFGSPLAISSGHEANAAYVDLARHGVFGVGLPTLSGVLGLLASPARGLLVWSPVVVLAAAGLARRSESGGEERATLVLVPVALTLAMAGYPNWHGGWFPGPRYLLATLPFVFVLVGRGAERAMGSRAARLGIAAAALWGAAQTWLSLIAFPFPPEDYPLPAMTFSWPLLRAGVVIPSWLPSSVTVAVVTALAAATALLVCRVACRSLREAAAALALAGALVASAFTTSPPATWQARLESAVVHDVYAAAPRPGALEALQPRCETSEQRAQLQRWIAARDTVGRPTPGPQ
jgi:hypothetical protein